MARTGAQLDHFEGSPATMNHDANDDPDANEPRDSAATPDAEAERGEERRPQTAAAHEFMVKTKGAPSSGVPEDDDGGFSPGPAASDGPEGLHIQMFSVHGLIRGTNLELGRDADTGGQTKYVVELARALAARDDVARVDLFTRRIEDDAVSDDYAREIEPLADGAQIVRIEAGGTAYRRKELLWPTLDAFVEGVLRFNREQGITPDVVHGHYADAGYVALELASYLGLPLVWTGHSLGRNKVEVLRGAGVDDEAMEQRYKIAHRIDVEEEMLRKADVVIASTTHEVERGYELYEGHDMAQYRVIPPGVEVGRFYPYFYDLDEGWDPGESVMRARVRVRRELERFFNDPEKPIILAISRPDKRKNIEGLVTAYGEDPELQAIANLAIFAGVRKDIREMEENEREVLTELLLRMDFHDLYGKMALPKKHDPDTDIPVLYRLAAASRGVFINPALVENFGITLIEASASGLPIVSTDHGGPQDIVANCDSGVLIDARDTGEIQDALKRILVDEAAWDRYSENGVNGAREHYAWRAHAESYLEALEPLLDDGAGALTDAEWRTTIGRHLSGVDRLLISDIDYTLIHEGDDERADVEALAELGRRLEDAGVGFGVASGRSLELVKDALAHHDLPQPAIVICSVGSEIYYGPDFLPDRGYRQHLRYRWKPEAIREALAELDVLEMQEPDRQKDFKISYYLEDADALPAIHDALQARKLRYNLIYSHGQFLDILPHRASKGKAIRYLSHKWGVEPGDIAVAGDSGNDEEMLRGRFRGIVVGNHAPELAELRGASRVYFADGTYARGVLEGLEHYGFVCPAD